MNEHQQRIIIACPTCRKIFPVIMSIVVFLLVAAMAAQAEDTYGLIWARNLGPATYGVAMGTAVDGSGNVYVTGYTWDSLEAGKTNAGGADVYLAKYTPLGDNIWVRQLGSPSDEYVYGIALDNTGNVYLTGTTKGVLQDGNEYTDNWKIFLAKYDPDGQRVWVRQMGTAGDATGNAIAVDGSGNVYVTGGTTGALEEGKAAGNDAYIAKYSTTGDTIWVRQYALSEYSYADGIAVDGNGYIYIAGYSNWTWEDESLLFIARYRPDGTTDWVRYPGSGYNGDFSGTTQVYDVAVNGNGNFYVAGLTDGIYGNAFLAKFDASGEKLWVQKIATYGDDVAYGVALDGNDNAYLTGWTDCDIQTGESKDEPEIFLAKYAADGAREWFLQLGSKPNPYAFAYNYAFDVTLDRTGNVYVTGISEAGLVGSQDGGGGFLAKFGSVSQQMGNIIEFFDACVGKGTITGSGMGLSANGKKGAFRNMLESVAGFIGKGMIPEACQQLQELYERADGLWPPPDFVEGAAVAALAGRVQSLRTSLGCQ